MPVGRPGTARPVRILQVADFYWPHLGGVEQHVRTLSHGLAARGHDVHVATLRTAGLAEFESDGPVTVHRVPSTAGRVTRLFTTGERPWAPPVPDPEATTALWRLVRRLRPDVVHGHDWLARSFAVVAPVLKRRQGTRYVSSQHYYTLSCAKKDLVTASTAGSASACTPCSGPSPARCLRCTVRHYGAIQGPVTLAGSMLGARMELATVDTMIAVSCATARGNRTEPGAVHVIGNPVSPVSPDDVADERVARLPTEFILFVGDLRPMKGLDVLFDAYRSLSASLDRVPPLVCIGKRWPDTPLEVPAGVAVFERWPNASVLRAWERAIIGVVPSVWAEPFGIVAIEALRGGTPVVASDTGGLAEIVRHGVEGLLVPPSDPVALAGAIRELLVDPDRRDAMSAAARRRAHDFTVDDIVDRVEAVYGGSTPNGSPHS